MRLPSNINLKTGIFLAIDHQLAAVFAVKYEASENVDYALADPAPQPESRRFWQCGTQTSPRRC